MRVERIVIGLAGAALIFGAVGASALRAAELPKATQAILKKLEIAYRAPEQAGAPDELNQIWSKYWTAGGGQTSDAPEE